MSVEELKNKLTVLMGGRAAESVVFENISTGAVDDLSKATEIARSMVTRYGMTDQMSEQTAREIDCAVRELINQALQRAKETFSSDDLPGIAQPGALSIPDVKGTTLKLASGK